MPGHDIIVIGASAGGVEAMTRLINPLPVDLPAALFVVLHIPAQSPSLLPNILTRAGRLPAIHPEDGEHIKQGRIYVAPPDRHLLLERERVRVVRGPKENRHRPAIDPLFRSAARTYGPRVIGVVLTGSLDDGTAGLLAIKRRGGLAIVQDPRGALYPSMPSSALEHVQVDYTLSVDKIGPMLVQLAQQQVEEPALLAGLEEMELETKMAEFDPNTLQSEQRAGTPSVFSCPECGGVLWELHDGDLLRFRCRVGHAFSVDSIISAQAEQVEDALWEALKTLQETATLARRMAAQARKRGQNYLARAFERREENANQRSAVIQRVLQREKPESIDDVNGDDVANQTS